MDSEKLKKLADQTLTLHDFQQKAPEDLALAVVLWKEMKGQPPEGDWTYATLMGMKMADALGVRKQYDELLSQLPPLRIAQKYEG